MVSIIIITALGIFAVGVVVGIIVMVSNGIRREQRRYEEARRFREEHGLWDDPDAPGGFLSEQAPDGVSLAARRLNGLYVRHLPTIRRYDAELALRA
jgi:hypothetical protein